MTKEEIKALIADKIAGQGNQVDSGGALADILNAIADAAFAAATGVPAFTLPELENAVELTEEQFLEKTGGVTFEQLKAATYIKYAEKGVISRTFLLESSVTEEVTFGFEYSGDNLDTVLTLDIAKDPHRELFYITIYEA